MASTPSPDDVRAAGAVVLRRGHVLLVHRPAYDDWSFPKGKLDRGESAVAAGVREVEEETGLRVRLGVPLARQSYPSGGRTKVVDYWVARVTGDPDVSGYLVNAEIDEVAWVPVDEARTQLTYSRDEQTLKEALASGKKTRALVVLRHGQARARKSWKRDDRLRPLVVEGRDQARAAVPLLAAYGVSQVVSSTSLRCVDTVLPYAEAAGLPILRDAGLSEEDATERSVRTALDALVDCDRDAVLCTHRPVLPTVYGCLGVETLHQATGELVVIHHRRGSVRSVERHPL
jgi:8-oxo-dGTP pyrophosphatase MutT (NUDIX family)/phosphohistidine phosphatase SixA